VVQTVPMPADRNDHPRAGLCDDCLHASVVRSDRGATFYSCELSATDPRFPKYPRLPVVECLGYEAKQD
jgi:hypothetical protein